jgi:hypothetical protein
MITPIVKVEELLASQEGLCSMELINYLICYIIVILLGVKFVCWPVLVLEVVLKLTGPNLLKL